MKTLDTIKQELSGLFEQSKKEGIFWDFNDGADDAEEQAKDCMVGRLIYYLYDLFDDKSVALRTIGLLTAFNARRSLACWFLYCVDERPKAIVDRLLDFWLSPDADISLIDESWLTEIVPTDPTGHPIVHCREEDMSYVSGGIVVAAKFALERKLIDAIQALCDAWSAWGLSPAGGYEHDLDVWSYEIAAPCAIEMREMSVDEQFAYGDFYMVSPTGHSLRSILLGEVSPEEVARERIRRGIPFMET